LQCDFEVRVLGNNQRHSVQCVLVINIFNEKIFILIWLWFSLLFVAATLDAMYWFSISLFHRDRFRFVLRHLELTSDPDRPELFRKEKRKQVEHFLRTYLKVIFVIIKFCCSFLDSSRSHCEQHVRIMTFSLSH
uniref:Innexin n=1 Tax=Toxocara canis TaxID=6265 RepID=A0A183U894_TOXCA